MLHTHPNRLPLSRRGWAVAVLVALGISLPLAAASLVEPEIVVPSERRSQATPVIQPPPVLSSVAVHAEAPPAVRPPAARPIPERHQAGFITGQVMDQTGGVIPGATVTLTERQTKAQAQATSNAMGKFEFPNLMPSEYELVTRLPGFKSVVSVTTVSSGNAAHIAVALPIGSLSETINVTCSPGSFFILQALFPVLSAQAASTPVRVGGSVRIPRKIRDVKPTCPASTPSGAHVVQLTGTIGVDGAIADVSPADAAVDAPADLIAASLDAIRQWAFTPTQLNRQAVEVTIEVTIRFSKR